MQQEDIVSAFVAIITLVLNLLPSITGTSGILTPDESAGLLSLAVILKAVLGDITLGQPAPTVTPPAGVTTTVFPPVTLPPPSTPTAAPVAILKPTVPTAPVSEVGTYQVTAITPNGQTYNGTLTVGTTKAAAIASLTSMGFTDIVIGAKQ